MPNDVRVWHYQHSPESCFRSEQASCDRYVYNDYKQQQIKPSWHNLDLSHSDPNTLQSVKYRKRMQRNIYYN